MHVGGEAGFAPKPLDATRIAVQPRHFQRDVAIEPVVVGEIDRSHPPAAQPAQNLVAPNRSGSVPSFLGGWSLA